MHAEPSFNAFTIFFLIVGIIGFLLTLFLYSNKNRRVSSWPIGLITLGFSLILIQYAMFWTGYLSDYPNIYFYDKSWYLAIGPLFYTYIVKFYEKDFKVNLFHFAPAILSLVLYAYYKHTTQNYTEITEVRTQFFYLLNWRLNSAWLSIVSLFIYLWISKDFMSFQNKTNQINNRTTLRLKWTSLITHFYALFVLAYTSYYTLVNFSFFNDSWDYAISVTMAIGIYSITYMVYKEPQIFNGELLSFLFKSNKEQNRELKIETKLEFYNQLLTYLDTKKPYLNNNLRLAHVSDDLNLPLHLLSQIINENAHKNFNQLINEYRLTEAEKRLRNDASLNIKDIYYDVGFNNKTTFYKCFKQKYGCTPLAYKTQNIQK